MSSHRLIQINELIKQELGKAFLTEHYFPPGCLATITKVETSPDLGQSKVLLSILPNSFEKSVLSSLVSRAGYFRTLLAGELIIRKMPKIVFQLDHSQLHASHIDQLIDKIHTEE